MADRGEAQELSYVKIYAGGKDYYILVDRIKLVALDPVIVPVPDAPEGIIGISIYKDTIVPYLDLHTEETYEQRRAQIAVIVSLDDKSLIGVLADRVSEQVRLTEKTAGKLLEEVCVKILGRRNV